MTREEVVVDITVKSGSSAGAKAASDAVKQIEVDAKQSASNTAKAFTQGFSTIENAAKASAQRHSSIFEQLFRRNGYLVSQFADAFAGQHGRMAASALRVAASYDDISTRSQKASAKAAEGAAKIAQASEDARRVVLDVGNGFVKIEGDAEKLSKAFSAFQKGVGQAASGKNSGALLELKSFGVSTESALRNPEQAFTQYIQGVQKLDSEAARTAATVNVLGASNAGLVSTLESAKVGALEEAAALDTEAASATAAATASSTLMATLIPIAAVVVGIVAAIALTVGSAAILYKLADSAAQYGARIYDAAKKTGASTEFISVLAVAADKLDIPLQKVSASYAMFERNASQAARGFGQNAKIFQGIDSDYKNLAKTQEGTQKLFVEFSKKVADASDSANKYNLIQQLTSRNGREVAQVLELVGKDFAGLQKQAASLGLLIKPEQSQRAKDLLVATNQLHQAWTGFVLSFGQPFVRLVTDWLDVFTHVLSGAKASTKDATQSVADSHKQMFSTTQLVIAGLTGDWELLNRGVALSASGLAESSDNVSTSQRRMQVATSLTLSLLGGDWGTFTLLVLTHIKSIVAAIETIPDVVKAMATAVVSSLGAVVDAFKSDAEAAGGLILAGAGDTAGAVALFTKASADASSASQKLSKSIAGAYNDIGAAYDKHRAALNFDHSTALDGGGEDTDLPSKVAKAKKQLDEYGKLLKEYKQLLADIDSLQDTGSPVNVLRFKVEGLKEVKSDLENILKLRHELGLAITEPLPVFDVKADEQTQAKQEKSIQAEIRRLTLEKSARDEVRKVVEEQETASSKLSATILSSEVPVVDTLTRYWQKYLDGVRERKNADADLTAQVLSNARLRKESAEDEAGNTLRAYRTLQLNLGKSEDELRAHIRENEVFLQALNDETSLSALSQADLQKRIGGGDLSGKPAVPQELIDIAKASLSLDTNVAAIAAKVTGQPAQSASSSATQAPSSAMTPQQIKQMQATRQPFVVSEAGGSSSASAQVAAVKQTTDAYSEEADEVVKVQTGIEGLTLAAQIRRNATLQAQSDITDSERQAATQILVNEGRLHNQLLDWETDLKLARSNAALERERQDRQVALDIALTEERLQKLRAGDAEEYARLSQSAAQNRLHASESLYAREAELDDKLAHAGEDAAVRERIAFKEALDEIATAHEEAASRSIKAQVKIADATVYHEDVANSKVLDFLAQQKSVTDAIADAKTGVIQATYDYISQGLDTLTRKLGLFGNVLNELITSLLKLALNSVFQRLFNLPGSSQQSSSSGGSGGLFGGLFGGIFGGGGSITSPIMNAQTSAAKQFLSFANQPGVGSGSGSAPFLNQQTASLASQLFFANPNMSVSQAFSLASNAQTVGFLPTVSQQLASQSAIASALSKADIAGASVGAAGKATGAAAAAATTSPLLMSLALAAPALGVSLGGGLFQSSKLASGIGAAAGGLLGASAGVLALGGANAAIFGAGGALSSLGAIAPLLTNPFTIAAGGAALIAAYFINRSAERRKEEEQRSQILTDAKTQIQSLITQAKSGSLSSADATTAAAAIRQNYLNQVGQLKDKKTRNIALATVRELDYLIQQLMTAAKASDAAKEIDKAVVPTFATGSFIANDMLALVHKNEVVLNTRQQQIVGVDRIAAANVPNYPVASRPNVMRSELSSASASAPMPAMSASSSSSVADALDKLNVQFLLVPNDDAADALVSSASPNTFVKKFRLGLKVAGRQVLGDLQRAGQ